MKFMLLLLPLSLDSINIQPFFPGLGWREKAEAGLGTQNPVLLYFDNLK